MAKKMKINKIDTQKDQLIAIIDSMIYVNISIMEFHLTLTNDKKERAGLRKWIKQSEKALEIVRNITHYEILVRLYNAFVNKKEIYFLQLVNSITDKRTIQRWDKTKKGFIEFLKAENDAIEQAKQKDLEDKEKLEFIRKAKEQGKKVEMLFKDGKLKPVIVEEKSN